jgi:repressor LexA
MTIATDCETNEPKALTKRQRELLDLVIEHSRLYGPTVRELCAAAKIASPNGVACHLKALERKGYVRRTPGKARAIEVLQ